MPHSPESQLLAATVYTTDGDAVVALADVARILGVSEGEVMAELDRMGQAKAVGAPLDYLPLTAEQAVAPRVIYGH